jgi:hypothetical protein
MFHHLNPCLFKGDVRRFEKILDRVFEIDGGVHHVSIGESHDGLSISSIDKMEKNLRAPSICFDNLF